MKKTLIPILISMFFLSGCFWTSFVVTDSAHHQAAAYAGGRLMGLAVCKLEPNLDKDLKAMADNFTNMHTEAMIPGADMLAFKNQAEQTMALYVDDPTGLVGDLVSILNIYSTGVDEEGNIITMNDVPKIVWLQFRAGWASSRAQVEREN